MIRRRTGRTVYLDGQRAPWGFEDWAINHGQDGLRTLTAHCELTFHGEHITRDLVQSVHPDFQPHDGYVRLMIDGRYRGMGWFQFDGRGVACESHSTLDGRLSQRMELPQPVRGFGTHALQGDAWLAARFDYSKGPGVQRFNTNPMCSTHHLGATGPYVMTTNSGFEYVGVETVTVPAGTFACHRIRFVGTSNNHPPYDMWVTTDGDFLFIAGEVGGYMAARFELVTLS
jgi:hypothetical protein